MSIVSDVLDAVVKSRDNIVQHAAQVHLLSKAKTRASISLFSLFWRGSKDKHYEYDTRSHKKHKNKSKHH
eukprot:scaffold67516_cov28-Tisochrysis_lutea.AAC.6